ncbi:MAG: FAD-binding oxidoreductase [Chloroflexota bacterium]
MIADVLSRSLPGVVEYWRPIDPSDGAYSVDGVQPSFVCEPGTPEEVAAILGLAHRERAAVTPRGGGARMSVGFPPRQADIVLLTGRLSGVVEYEPADLTVTVQAGMPFAALQTLLRDHGQMLAMDPPAADRSTIGGIVASNSSGPMRLLYGTARDLVIGTRVANAEGMLTKSGGRVVKNVSGYDLNKLYTGSYGTLGVIVELSFKLHPLPQGQGTLLAIFSSVERAQDCVQRIVKSPLGPAALTIVSVSTARAILHHEVPAGGVALIAMAAGFERAVERQIRDMAVLCGEALITDTPESPEAEEIWAAVRRFADLTEATSDAILKLSVPPARSGAALQTLAALSVVCELPLDSLAYAGTGVVFARVHLPGSSDARSLEGLVRLVTEARAWAHALRGSLVVEHCPSGLKETLDVWGDVGSSFRVMQALKEQFDPAGVLNPGRFVGHL